MKIILVKIILFFFLLMPLVESINGYFYGKGVSDIYRSLLLILIIIYFLYLEKWLTNYMLKFMFLICTFFVLLSLQYLFFHKNQGALISDIKSVLRILLAPMYFVFFNTALQLDDINLKDLKKLFIGYSLLYCCLILFPYLQGKGFVSYDFDKNGLVSKSSEVKGIGNKGYFIELNSLTAILSACSFFIKNMIIESINDNFKNLILLIGIYILLIISLFVTATKLGITLAFVCSVILIIQIYHCGITIQYRLGIALFIFSFSFILWFSLENLLTEIFLRLNYFYVKFGGDILNVITSNRFNYLAQSMQQLDQSNHRTFIDFFGAGYYSSFSGNRQKRIIVEMDWFDFYFSYGIIGFSAYLYFFKDVILSIFASKKNYMKTMIVIFLIYSFMGGHIFVNSMTVTFLAICFAYFSFNEGETKE